MITLDSRHDLSAFGRILASLILIALAAMTSAAEDLSPAPDLSFNQVSPTSFTDDCCDTCCNCGSSCSDKRLLGLIRPSDHCYDRFISPLTNPVFFEDPRTLTEARAIYLNHNVPAAAAGGDVQLIALQLRAAITERLSLVASKDGYIISSNDLIDDGWADVAAGLKYNLFADPVAQRLLSAGFHYEMPVGTPRAIQGNGDGEFHIYLTGGAEFLD